MGSEDDVLNDEGLYEAVVFSSLLLCFPDTDLQSLSLLPPLLLCMSNQVILLYACNSTDASAIPALPTTFCCGSLSMRQDEIPKFSRSFSFDIESGRVCS